MAGQLLGHVVRFARELRAEGVLVTPDQVATLAQALLLVSLSSRDDMYLSARAILVSRREDLAIFDKLFEQFWRAATQEFAARGVSALSPERRRPPVQVPLTASQQAKRQQENQAQEQLLERALSYSSVDVLKERRFEELSEAELELVKQLMVRKLWEVPRRRTRRFRAATRPGRLDLRRTLKFALRRGGEWLTLAWRQPKVKPRPLVALLDVSGSMERYARMMLVFLFVLAKQQQQPFEAFVFGTQLSRITPQLQRRELSDALAGVAKQVHDWSGGTRIGACLDTFRRDYAKRALGRGAVVLLVSDGWDRGEPERLAAMVAWLQRRAQRLIWLNPLLGSPGYQPLTRGMQAALPHVDDFLPVHNLSSLEELSGHLARLSSRRSARSNTPLPASVAPGRD